MHRDSCDVRAAGPHTQLHARRWPPSSAPSSARRPLAADTPEPGAGCAACAPPAACPFATLSAGPPAGRPRGLRQGLQTWALTACYSQRGNKALVSYPWLRTMLHGAIAVSPVQLRCTGSCGPHLPHRLHVLHQQAAVCEKCVSQQQAQHPCCATPKTRRTRMRGAHVSKLAHSAQNKRRHAVAALSVEPSHWAYLLPSMPPYIDHDLTPRQQASHLRGEAPPSAGTSASYTATAPSPRATATRRPTARGASMGPAATACTSGGLKTCRQCSLSGGALLPALLLDQPTSK